MTKKLFWDLPYQTEFQAKVTDINGNQIILDQTLFYPTGGGIVCDRGKINGIKVVETRKGENENIIHVLEKESDFKIGEEVNGRIDWERRYKLMRLHTAAHLLSAILFKYTGAMMTGGNIDEDKARDDFSVPLNKEDVQKFVDETNEIIEKGAEVKIYFLSREDALKIPAIVKLAEVAPPNITEWRIVEIVGYDIQADGGLHVKNISEIKKIGLLKVENKGKNNRRIYYSLTP